MSMMGLCNDSVIIEYDRRRSAWIPSAPLDMDYDNIITEENPSKHKHNPYSHIHVRAYLSKSTSVRRESVVMSEINDIALCTSDVLNDGLSLSLSISRYCPCCCCL